MDTPSEKSKHPNISNTDSYQYVLDQIQNANLDAIIVDITNPAVADMGVCAVRAIIPGTMDLNSEYITRSLNVQRLYDVPKLFGKRGGELNKYPHPLS